MTTSKVSSLNSEYQTTIYEDTMYVLREQSLMPLLVTNYTGTGTQGRKAAIYSQNTAQEVSEGVDYANATELTKTNQMSITIKFIKSQYILTDQLYETDPEDARVAAATEMGGAAATKIDSDLVDLFSGFDSGLGAAGSALTIKHVGAAMALLRNAYVRNPINCVWQPYHWNTLWYLLDSPAANQAFLGDVANQAMRDYYVGDWIQARHFIDNNITVDSDDDAYSGIFHREALALDVRKAPFMEFERDASLSATEINLTTWYGVAERRGDHGVYMYFDATTPTGD